MSREHRQSRCQAPRFPGLYPGQASSRSDRARFQALCKPVPQVLHKPLACAVPVGAGLSREHRQSRCQTPRFPGCTQGKPPPAVIALAFKHCASQSHRYYISPEPAPYLWERACPANTGKAGARHRVSPVCPQGKPPPGSQISTWVPSSITRFSGRLKKRRLPLAFFSKNANRLPRQRDMPSRREAMTVSRLRK